MHYEFMYGDNKIKVPKYKESKVLWSGTMYPLLNQTATFSENVSSQNNGIIIVFSRYDVGVGVRDYGWTTFYIPKQLVALKPEGLHHLHMSTALFDCITSKTIRISNTAITGNDDNQKKGTANGITYDNSKFAMRYVIGV